MTTLNKEFSLAAGGSMLVWCVICRSVGRSVFALGVFSPNCSGETWPRQQEVISRRAATVVIHHHADGCLSLRYRLEDCAGGEPKQCGQSMRAFHSPWTSAFWSSPLIGRALLRYCWDFFFFSALCYEKEWVESDEHFGVGSLLSFSRMCMAYVRESCCVPPSLPRTHRSRLEVWFKFAL